MEPSASFQWIIILLNFLPVIFLLALGFIVGRLLERRHLKSLFERERAASSAIPTNLKMMPDQPVAKSFLVIGSVVIASDYYKTIGARLKAIVGGRLRTLETLMDRGRREAIMRMREQAAAHGAHLVLNVRLETSTITRSARRTSMPSMEVIAYGTAVVYRNS